ncbi:MAG: hypothetical protein LBN27_08525, partial [Prevotellaceae bacterium]|nr:hypothetical protein [Prevotellaceae bacterium]
TKEKLFDTVFENKAIEFLTIFKKSVDKDLPFIKKVKEFVETHFDFIEKMPKVPLFLMREVIANKEKRDFILSKILPLGISAFDKLENLIKTEAEKGHIRQVKALDLMLNIASLNVMTFVLAQVYYGFDNQTDKNLQDFLAQRKLNNVELILRSLQI